MRTLCTNANTMINFDFIIFRYVYTYMLFANPIETILQRKKCKIICFCNGVQRVYARQIYLSTVPTHVKVF